MAPAPRPAAAIVGRSRELASLDAFVDAVASGARAMVLVGEPGIGKTTLWRYGVERSAASGMRVLRARPAQDEMALSSAGLADLFEGIGPEIGSDDPFTRGRAVLGRSANWPGSRPSSSRSTISSGWTWSRCARSDSR